MMNEERYLEEGNILCLVRQNADKIRGDLDINIHIGTADVLFCDNEILHMYLDSLSIPHKYRKFYGVGHELDKIVLKEQEHKGKAMMLKHKGTVTLETERLILRRFKPEDAETMYANWCADHDVTKYLMWPPHGSIDETRQVLEDIWLSRYDELDFYQWAIEVKEIHEPIGSIGVVKSDDKVQMVHIGYCIGKAWWHKGYTSEALSRLVQFFFEEAGVNRIETRHDPRNPNSGKVMQKAGLRYEGTSLQSDWNNTGICDAANYAILARDYFENSLPTLSVKPVTRTATQKRIEMCIDELLEDL
jgi:ribosomal-protein-alanine N-acetyltransferase